MYVVYAHLKNLSPESDVSASVSIDRMYSSYSRYLTLYRTQCEHHIILLYSNDLQS